MGFIKDKTNRRHHLKHLVVIITELEPLERLFEFCVTTFQNASGRKLSSIECHDIVCKIIAEIVVVGGVRRSAVISLSNLSDDKECNAQVWSMVERQWTELYNNSICYTEKPDMGIFMDEWKSLYESKSGGTWYLQSYL